MPLVAAKKLAQKAVDNLFEIVVSALSFVAC
jgi:hypothetical protein